MLRRVARVLESLELSGAAFLAAGFGHSRDDA